MNNPPPTPPPQPETEPRSRVLTLAFTDLVASVALRSKLGDIAAGRIINRHFEIVRNLLQQTGGREIMSTGDGVFVTFDAPSAGVDFALRLQQAQAGEPHLPKVRVGINVGEVTERPALPGSNRTIEVEGFAADLAARIMSLALPGQILLSFSTFDNARQRLGADRPRANIAWRAHGRYHFKGNERPIALFEAGIEGISPLVPPPDSEKASRVDSDDPLILGWRPAHGLDLPHRPNWTFVGKLGDGGFGEVWLATHKKTGERRVFKFCYSLEHLRALKREVALFRLLKETLGNRDDIAMVLDWQFEEPPYYIEMEHVGGDTLDAWMEKTNSVRNMPLRTRLEIIAKVADAVAAAHSAGILHKDIKPSNILLDTTDGAQIKVRMIDFGIGVITNKELLLDKGVTLGGATESILAENDDGRTGTRIYMAPEILEGRPATTLSDIYSLGVLLYQIVIRDFSRSLAPGWQRDVPDDILREDIAACVDGQPSSRLASAAELADRLRRHEERRDELAREELQRLEAEQARAAAIEAARNRKFYLVSSVLGTLLLLAAVVFAMRERERAQKEEFLRSLAVDAKNDAEFQRQQVEAAKVRAVDSLSRAEQEQYFSAILAADAYMHQGRKQKVENLLLNLTPPRLRQLEWGWLVAENYGDLMTIDVARQTNELLSACYGPQGRRIASADREGNVSLWNAATGKLILRAKAHQSAVHGISFSPDGMSIATACFDGTAAILDADTLARRTILTGHQDNVRTVSWSPDGRSVLTASRDGTARIWDVATGRQTAVFEDFGGAVFTAAFNRDGTEIVVASREHRVSIHSVATGKARVELGGHPENILDASFSPDNTRVITACTDRKARIFDVATGRLETVLNNATSWLLCAAFNRAGKLAATGDNDGVIRLWELQSGKQIAEFQSTPQVYSVEFSPDDRTILAASRDSIRLWPASGQVSAALERSDWTPDTSSTTFGAPERLQVFGYPLEAEQTWWGYDWRWQRPFGRTVFADNRHCIFVDSHFTNFSPDDQQSIIIDSKTYQASVRDNRTSQVVAKLGSSEIMRASFSADGLLAETTDSSGVVTLWNASDWKPVRTLDCGGCRASVAKFSPSSHILAVGCDDGQLLLFDGDSGKRVITAKPHSTRVLSIAFTRDGRLFATGSADSTAKIIDSETGNIICNCVGHEDFILGLTFSPDGQRLATSGHDDKVILWDTASGREIVTLFSFPGPEFLLGAGISRNGQFVYAINSQHELKIAQIFPWQPDQLPGSPKMSSAARIELLKRNRRVSLDITEADINWN
ncbi:MAG: protein kinase [Candidatus Sumerlaeaceae bacterium]|nr:protein kinase [Candidatus Sumerlaeaceae bacterium]